MLLIPKHQLNVLQEGQVTFDFSFAIALCDSLWRSARSLRSESFACCSPVASVAASGASPPSAACRHVTHTSHYTRTGDSDMRHHPDVVKSKYSPVNTTDPKCK